MSEPRIKSSQSSANAGEGAWALTVIALACNAIVWRRVVPDAAVPALVKAVFVLVGALLVLLCAVVWRSRMFGGGAGLALSQDPVAHGLPNLATFTLSRPLDVATWTVEALVETSEGQQSGFGQVWRGRFAATPQFTMVGGQTVTQAVTAAFTLPVDVPSTQDKHFRATLTLKGGANLGWRYSLQTRPASASELAFQGDAARAPRFGPALEPLEPSEPSALMRPRVVWLRRGLQLVMVGVFAWFAWDFAQSVFTDNAAQYGTPNNLSPPGHDTGTFPVTVSNWLVNDWAYRAHLEGDAEVRAGWLRVTIKRLMVMPINRCPQPGDCQIESVGLLLSQDTKDHFNTLAESGSIPWRVDLREVRRASLGGGEFLMQLPAALPDGDVRLKLVVRSKRRDATTGEVSTASVYPSHGNHLALQQALAHQAAQAAPSDPPTDPCNKLVTAEEAVKASCNPRVVELLRGHTPMELDALLIAAVQHFNMDAVALLLDAGASPNATEPDNPSHTVLGLAASGNQLHSVELLLKAGANVNHRVVNEDGVAIMPLTQALRRDPAAAVARLLQAGATLHNDDPKGWTVISVAAFEGATESMPALAAAGADMNERTTADRQQTAFLTAVQHAPQATIEAMLAAGAKPNLTDSRGENACGWSKFFKRSGAIQALVCPP